MNFKGYAITFSTIGEKQYESIGNLWDYLSEIYGRENIQGLGFLWTETSIDYCFGFKKDVSEEEYKQYLESLNLQPTKPFRFVSVELPDDSWVTIKGETDKLSELYDDVYSKGSLDYEIETFNDDGTCEIKVHYIKIDEELLNRTHRRMRVAEALAIAFDVIGFILAALLLFSIYEVITSNLNASFLGAIIPGVILFWFVHCGFLVNRVNKRKSMAKRIIELRLNDTKRDQMAQKYHVKNFVDSMIEVLRNSTEYSNPL